MPGDLPSIEDLLKETAAHADTVSDSKNAEPTPADTAAQEPAKKQAPLREAKESPAQTADKQASEQPTSTEPAPVQTQAKEETTPIPSQTTAEPQPTSPLAEEAGTTDVALDKKMQEIALSAKEKEAEQAAASLGVPYVNLQGFAISTEALKLLPREQAESLKTILFLHTGPEMRIGSVDPSNADVQQLVHTLGERHKTHAVLYKISEESFSHAIKLYDALPKVRKIVKGVQITEEELERYQQQMDNLQDIQGIVKKANVTDMLSIVTAAALKLGSSDIHIEAEEKHIAIRLRIDGMLQDVATIEKDKWKKIINRIKLIAGLKMNIDDRPQDGRFTIFQKNRKIDVRTSTLPTAWGESVVMRILNPDTIKLAFEELGFRPASLKRLMHELKKPNGMIVTTGPTGSGKTTTLYAMLKKLNEPDVKIITLEDPVEYKLEGINQSQIDQSKDYTFAQGLRSILRQDPDIVLVGEIRDLETAETAIQAALTGHLLLSTIHTNDAAGAIPRFVSMGVKPFLLAPAINAIMGQRLARRLCQECKKETTIDPETQERVKAQLSAIPESSGETVPDLDNLTFFGPSESGCQSCNGTGYTGRIGLYEILTKDKAVEEYILSGEISEYQMREVAAKQGMVTMAQDGLLKALEGFTSVAEIERVTGLN